MIAAVEPARSTVDTPKTTASMKPRSMMIARSVQVRSAMIACAMARASTSRMSSAVIGRPGVRTT
ncbi:hypothetical protein [Microbacterium lacticum]